MSFFPQEKERGVARFGENDAMRIFAGSIMPTLSVYAYAMDFPVVRESFFLVFINVKWQSFRFS